jgi:uncharacterized protein (DUF1499 family)
VSERRHRWLLVIGAVLLIAVAGRLAVGLVPPPSIGLRFGALQPCPDADNCARSDAADPRHAVDPLLCPDEVFEEVVGVALTALPRTELVEVTNGYAHLRSTSRWFGFVDDLELLADDGVIQVRSAARLGRNDYGVNRARIERLRESLDETGLCG